MKEINLLKEANLSSGFICQGLRLPSPEAPSRVGIGAMWFAFLEPVARRGEQEPRNVWPAVERGLTIRTPGPPQFEWAWADPQDVAARLLSGGGAPPPRTAYRETWLESC